MKDVLDAAADVVRSAKPMMPGVPIGKDSPAVVNGEGFMVLACAVSNHNYATGVTVPGGETVSCEPGGEPPPPPPAAPPDVEDVLREIEKDPDAARKVAALCRLVQTAEHLPENDPVRRRIEAFVSKF